MPSSEPAIAALTLRIKRLMVMAEGDLMPGSDVVSGKLRRPSSESGLRLQGGSILRTSLKPSEI
jgi:hypothetical protein